ncbi:unnamed protein product [Chironomus riparius]|uniref:Ig-like domain-containing protein n=1 Tax=Chironomus riparius TaxID=315576 RepID=A0A9P0IKT2_9DIPT|nr:unnamed protein product [Chironomus riparius]
MGSNCCKSDPGNKIYSTVSSNSSVYLKRTRDGKPITNSEKFKVTKTKNAIQLAIQHVQRDDAGHYTLYAKTDTGETAQKDIELLVEDRSFGDNPPVFLRRLNDLAVKVGTRTRLLVEIRSATDVRVTWYRNDRRICENDRINFVNEGSFYCLEISSITLDDGGKWMCMAENLGGRNSCLATLNVLVPKAYKAPEFVEELRALLTEQGTVSLECKVVGVPTPILRWFKDSKEIKAGDVFALTANPDDLTSLGTYTCEAVNCMGKTYSSSKLHISGKTSRESSLQPSTKLHGPPPIFTSELKNINSKIGDSITLGCQVMVPPWPKSVTWYNKEGKIESSEKYKLIEDGMGSYILEIKPAEYSDEGEWKFVVASNEGTVSISTCSVHMDIPKNYRKPRFMENLKAILTEEGLVSFECKVVGFPTPLLRWFKDGHELKPGDVYQLTGTNSLGSYSCIARNCMGEACSSAVLTLEDIQNQLNENERIELQQKNQPPKFIKGLMSCDTKINEEFKFTVQIKATTEPVFSWYRDDLPVDKTNERYEICTEKIGFCHLTIKCVEFVDQAEWKCVATNEFGHSTSTCFLKLQIPRHYKKPRFLECLRAVLTEEGAVNLECKVIGVPQPTLRWFKDGVELKPGDIHRIISGKDGECSLGTYTCEARNCMGVVTSSATLLGYEENYKSIPKPEPANILQRHLSLSTIHEERTSQLYDTPMGDITVDEKGDVSFSFDGKEVSVSLYETPDLTEEEALQIVEMYADQISEHVTEQNIVELPPLRFVKETTQSGNLLMEAVVIDVSPDYFPPEEDMRTEADMEDISVVDAMSQAFEDPLSEQSMSKRRRKEESLKSGEMEEFFSLSQSKQTKLLSILENYVVEEAHSDEEITETDLQTFESAKSSEKGDSDKQKKIIKSDDSLQEQPPKLPPRKRPTLDSKDEDSIYLQDISGEQGDGLKTQTKKKIDVKTIITNKSIIEKVIKTVIIIKQHLIAVENEVIAQSSLMMSPTSGDSSIGIVKSVLEPINAIECKVNEYNGERNVDNLIENLMPDLKSLNHGLSIIEKCVEMDSEGKTLVQRTSVCVIESVGIQMLAFLESLKQVCLHNVQGSLQNESLLIINDMQTGIHITEDTIKSQTLIQEASALEASQRVSETVAQMQQNVPETVPLEVVTTTELPKEANSFKLLCRYILKFQEILETSQQSDVKKETLVEIQKPIIDIQNEIHLIEEKISKNSLKDTIEEKISFKILDTVSPPLYELNKCFEAITKNVESGNKSPKILDPFILPLQEIQTGLALIGHEIDSGFIKKESPIDTEDNQKLIKNVSQNVIYVESNIENIRDVTSTTVYDSLIQLKITISTLVEKIIREPRTKGNLQIIWALKIPLEELNYCFRHIEERSTSGSLRDLLDPLNSLKENMEVVEEKLRQMRVSCNVEDIKKIKNLVDQCDAEIQLFDIIQLDHQERINQQRMSEQQLSEHTNHLSEMQQRSNWTQEKCDVLSNVHQNIVNIQEIIGYENNKSFSEQLSTLKTLAVPLRELSRQIANIREEILLENVNDISINDYKAILKLANPIREICQQLAVITKTSTFETAQIFSSKSDQESLKSLAVSFADLRNCIASIQHECTTLHEIQGEITHPHISLKTARPLEELRLCVEEIIHNIVEPDEISTTLDDISVMKTLSEMSDEVKVESSYNKVKVTETKVETAYIEEKKEEKVIENMQLDVDASDIDEKKSRENQQHVDIKTDVETTKNIEKEDETLKDATEEFKSKEQKFSIDIQTHLLKMKEDMETVMIAVQNMRRPTPEVQTIEKELKIVLNHVSNLPNNVNEMEKIIEIIELAEKSISIRKTSDVILVKYNLESLKKTLKIIIETIYPDHVEKTDKVQEKMEVITEKVDLIEEKIELTDVEMMDATKVKKLDILPQPEKDINITKAENQVKKVKILIKKNISTIPELQGVEQELEFTFENLAEITNNPDKLDRAIEVINVAESKLITANSPELVEIRECFATLKQILITFKSSISAQQVKIEDINKQVENSQVNLTMKSDDLKIVESGDARIENIIESNGKTKLKEENLLIEIAEKIVDQSVTVNIESKTLEIVEIKAENLKIIEEDDPRTDATVVEPVQNILIDEVKESNPESIETGSEKRQFENLNVTEEQVRETVSEVLVNISDESEKQEEIKELTENVQEIKEVKECTETEIQEEPQTGNQKILPAIQECLTITKENIETVFISIKKVRRPTNELQAVEKELSIIFESISELSQNQQKIEKVIEKVEIAESSLVTRKTSDIVIMKENLLVLKKSLIALNDLIKSQKDTVKDIDTKPQNVKTEIIEIKEVLEILEEDKNVKFEEVKASHIESHEKKGEIEKPDLSEPKESNIKFLQSEIQEKLTPTEDKLGPEIEQCLLKTKNAIETVTSSIKKVQRITPELKSVQGELNVMLESVTELTENVQNVEKIIESIEKTEASLVARKTSDVVLVKENLSNLKQCLFALTNIVKSRQSEIIEAKPQLADLKIFESSEELKIVESNECIAEKIQEEIVEKGEEIKLSETVEEKLLTILKVEDKSLESIELDKCIEKSKGEIEHTIESIHKVRRMTPEIQAIETQLSTTFENVKGLQNNDKIIEEILNKIDAAEESIAIRRTSDITDLKGNLANLKQCLVTLRTVVTQHNIQVQTIQIQPQKAVVSVIESKEKLQATKPFLEEKIEATKEKEESKTVDSLLVEPVQEMLKSKEQSEGQKVEEIKESQIEKLVEIPTKVTVCLTKTKTEIENVIASVKKVRRQTNELQAAQEELSNVLEELESLSENPEQLDKIVKTINRAENSLILNKTSDTALVKDNLIKLKEALVLLSYAVETQKESTEELKILESNESLTEKVLKNVQEEIIDQTVDRRISETKIVQEEESESVETEKLQRCIQNSKEEIGQTIESIKKVRKSTPEIQAIEIQLFTTFENVKDILNNQKIIEDILNQVEIAEASVSVGKTSDIVSLKENLSTLKQSLVTLKSVIIHQNAQLKSIDIKPQHGEMSVIGINNDLKIDEQNEETITEKNSISKDVKKIELVTKTEDCIDIKSEIDVTIKSGKTNDEELKMIEDTNLIKELEKLSEAKGQPALQEIQKCLSKTKENIETVTISIKKAHRPTGELQCTEKELAIILENISELPQNQQQIEKIIEKIEAAETSLVARKTSDIILVKENLNSLKQSLVTLNNTIKTQNIQLSTIMDFPEIVNLQVNEVSQDLKVVESNESKVPTVQPLQEIIEKSMVEIENTVEAIKNIPKPTLELQATEKNLITVLENLSDLQHDEKTIEKVLESVTAAETSLTATKTSEIVLIKENLSQLKESLKTLKTNVEELKVNNTESPTSNVKILDLHIIEPSNDLKIIESNEDLAVTDESKQLLEVTLSLAKSRDEIENVMFAIRKARHPPSEVSSVEKILTLTYEQLFELPKDDKFFDKAIESIELAEISLVTRGAGDLIVIKNNLASLKESFIKIISFQNPQKAASLLNELQKPQVAKMSEIHEPKQVKEVKPQELTSKQKLETLIEKTVDSIKNSHRLTPEVQAIEKEFTFTLEKVMNLENDKQEIEKVIELIETAEASFGAKRTSDIVLIKENLALVKETLNILKLTIQSKPIEIIELQQQKPEQAIIVDEKLKEEELVKEIVSKKSEEKQQGSLELKESEEKLSLHTEIHETQKQQPNENVKKLKTEIVSTIESIKKVLRPNTEIQAVERELTMAIEHVNELPNDEKKIENVIAVIENTEASLVAKKTSDIAVVKNNLSELKQTLNLMKTSKKLEIDETELLTGTQKEQEIVLEELRETKKESTDKSNEIQKNEKYIKEGAIVIEQPTNEKIETLKTIIEIEKEKPVVDQTKANKDLKEEMEIEKISLSKDQLSIKSDLECSIQPIKINRPTSELKDTEKIISKTDEKPKEEIKKVTEKPKEEIKKVTEKPKEEIKKVTEKPKEEIRKVDEKPEEEIKKVTEKPEEEIKKVTEKPKEEIKKVIEEPKEEIKKVTEKPKEEITKVTEKPKEEIKKVTEKPKEEIKKVDEKPEEEIKKITEKPEDEIKKVTEKPKEEITKVTEEPKEEIKKVTEKPKEEIKKVTEKPKEEIKKVDEKPEEEIKKVTEKPEDEIKKVTEKPKEEITKVTEEPKEEIKKVTEKPKEEIKKVTEKPKEEIKKVDEKPEEQIKKVTEKPKEEIKKVTEKPKEEIKKVDEKPEEEIKKVTEKPEDEIKKVTEKPKEEITKVTEEPKEEIKKVTEKPKEEIKKVTEKPKEEIKKVDEKPEEEIKKVTEKPKEEIKKVTEKPKEEITKVTEKPKEEIKKVDEKPEEEIKKVTEKPIVETLYVDEKPEEEIKKADEKPKEESKVVDEKSNSKKLDVKLPAEKTKIKIEIVDAIDLIKKIRRATPELNATENELKTILEHIKEFPNNQHELLNIISSIECAETSLATRRTSDIMKVKEKLNSLKSSLCTFKNVEKIVEFEVETLIEQAEVEKNDKLDATEFKTQDSKIEKIGKTVQEEKPEKEINPDENKLWEIEKPKSEGTMLVEPLKCELKSKILESDTMQKLRTEIANVTAIIKNVRRPTPELQSVESELTIFTEKLPKLENKFEEIDRNIKIIVEAENSIKTKKTSDILAVKESFSKFKNLLTEIRDSIKPNIDKEKLTKEEKTENIEQSQRLKPKEENGDEKVEVNKKDEAVEVASLVDETEEINQLKSKEKLKHDETQKSKDVEKSVGLPKIEEKSKLLESAVVQKLRTEIENVSNTIKKVKRPTSELQSTDSELRIIINKLSDIENDVVEINKIIKIIIKTEDSIITKRTSDILEVKESLLCLKNVLQELSDSKKSHIEKPKEEQPKNEEKDGVFKQIEEIIIEEKPEMKLEQEISIQSQKTTENPIEIETPKVFETKKSEQEPKLQEIEIDVKEKIVKIRLDEASLKIKSEIENVIHSIKKSRRPTTEIQTLEKILNADLELKVLVELSKNLTKIEETLKSIEVTESSLATKKTSDMILVKNNINLLKEVLISCKTKLSSSQEIREPEKTSIECLKQEIKREPQKPELPELPELPKEFEQPSEVLLDIHEKDLMSQYIVGIKQDIDEVLVLIKKARRPSAELQTLHEALLDLKPRVDNLSKDSTYFDTVLHIVTKAKTALLTKRTMEMILLREKVTSLESSLILLKSTVITEINGEIIAAKQIEETVTEKTKEKEIIFKENEIVSNNQNAILPEQEEKLNNVLEKSEQEQVKKFDEFLCDPVKLEDTEPQKPARRQKHSETSKIDEIVETKTEKIEKVESKTQKRLESEISPAPTDRLRQRQSHEILTEIQSEVEPVKPLRRKRADELKEEEKSLPRTPETRRKRMPIFIARLKNRSAPENSILKLTCAVSEPEVTARWTKNGMILKDTEKYLIENSNGVLSLEIKNACFQDAGEYYCFVSNSCGEIETSAFVTIFGEDVQPSNTTFTKNLRDSYDQVTNKLIIECNIKTSLDFSNHKIKWYKDDMEMRPSYMTSSGGIPTTYEQEIDENTGRVKLIITYPMNTDCGLYRCCVHDKNSHKVDEISHLVYKIFNPPPHIPLEELEIGEKRNRIVFDNHLNDIYADDTNKSIRLNCKISQCNAQSEIKWYKNNEELPIEDYREKYRFTKSYNRLCLEILHPKLNDAGVYECSVKNQYNETSTKCHVYVNEKAERQRSKTTPRESSFIDFSTGTIIDKEQSVNYQDEIEDSNKILLERSTREIAARIHRSTDLIDIPPSSVTFTATERPNFATPLSDRMVTENSSSVKFTCSLLSPECDISWEKNGIPIRPSSKFTQTFTDGLAILEIFDVSDDDAGKYACTASNKFGDNSTSARLKVYSGFKPSVCMPPTVMRQMKESYNLYNDLLTLECRVRGTPKPHIQWMKDGDYIMPGDKYQQTELPDGTCKLIIQSPDPEEDSGTYTCEAECNGCSDSISHNVQYEGSVENQFNRVHRYYHRDPLKPYFKTGLVDTNVPSGGSIALFVESQANCEAEWYRDRWIVDHKPPKRYIFNDGSGFFACVINHATMDEAAKYSCKLSNPYGTSQSTSFIDVINPNQVGKGQKPPIFLTRPQPEIKIRAGDPFSMSFRVQGEPKPRIQWYKGARDITNAGRTIKEVFNDYVRFSIKESKENDSGIYFITARNRHGVDRSFCQVTVKQARTGKKDEKKIEEKVEENVETVDRSEKGRN